MGSPVPPGPGNPQFMPQSPGHASRRAQPFGTHGVVGDDGGNLRRGLYAQAREPPNPHAPRDQPSLSRRFRITTLPSNAVPMSHGTVTSPPMSHKCVESTSILWAPSVESKLCLTIQPTQAYIPSLGVQLWFPLRNHRAAECFLSYPTTLRVLLQVGSPRCKSTTWRPSWNESS